MKKKCLAVIFAAMMAFGVAACGGAADEHEGHDHATEQNVEETVDGEEETPAEAEEMITYLQQFPNLIEVDTAVAEGFYTITADGVAGGQENWDAFMAGEAESVILCQYTAKGGAVLDYLTHRADGSYIIVSDSSRDGYTEEEKMGENYEVQEFAALKVFEDFSVQEGAQAYTIGVLTNEPGLDADTFRTYWNEGSTAAHQAYLLYVI